MKYPNLRSKNYSIARQATEIKRYNTGLPAAADQNLRHVPCHVPFRLVILHLIAIVFEPGYQSPPQRLSSFQ